MKALDMARANVDITRSQNELGSALERVRAAKSRYEEMNSRPKKSPTLAIVKEIMGISAVDKELKLALELIRQLDYAEEHQKVDFEIKLLGEARDELVLEIVGICKELISFYLSVNNHCQEMMAALFPKRDSSRADVARMKKIFYQGYRLTTRLVENGAFMYAYARKDELKAEYDRLRRAQDTTLINLEKDFGF